MAKSKTDARTLTAKQRRAEAIELRLAGYTFERIGQHLNITPQAAHKTVMVALAETIDQSKNDADKLRELELLRLDRLQQAIWPRCLQGDLKAMDRVDRIMKRRALLLGLDAPNKTAFTNLAGTEEAENLNGVILVPAVANSIDEWLKEFAPDQI